MRHVCSEIRSEETHKDEIILQEEEPAVEVCVAQRGPAILE